MKESENYWASPEARLRPEVDEFGMPARPGVLTWFYLYCGVLAAVYILVGLLLMLVLILPFDGREPDEILFTKVMGSLLGLVCGALGAVFAAAIFLPRRPWAWVYDIVLIALGFTSCATWPASIPLLIFWLKPETQRYFGRGER